MAFNKNWDVGDVMRKISIIMNECTYPDTDSFTACYCKHDLYQIKCFIEDNWDLLPVFPEQERQWEQDRIVRRLRRT